MVCEIDGIGARLERAKENIIDLTGEVSAFLRMRCDAIVAPDNLDHHDQSVQNVLQPSEPPIPSRFGALAGESIYLMRSALDHLAWQLVIAGGGEPGPSTRFPVFAFDPARSDESLAKYNRCVEGMGDTAKARIKTLQPYHRHGWLKQNALWILDDMSTTDQHSALPLGVATYRQQQIPACSTGKMLKVSQIAHDGGTAAMPAVDMHADGEGSAYVSFGRFGKLTDVAVVDGLWLLWHATNGICASFAAELTASPGGPLEQLLPDAALGRREHGGRYLSR